MSALCSSSMKRLTVSGGCTWPLARWISNRGISASIRSWPANAPGALCRCLSRGGTCTPDFLECALLLLDRVHQRMSIRGLGHFLHLRIRVFAQRQLALQLIDDLQNLRH